MQLRFYALMRTVTGIPYLDVEDVKIDTTRKVIDFLVKHYLGADFQLLDETGTLRQDAPIFVNGRNPRLLINGIDTPLPRDAVVSFFSPVSSGRMNVEVLREPDFRKGSGQ